MSLTDEEIRTLGDALDGPQVAELWIIDNHGDAINARLDRLENTVRQEATHLSKTGA